MDFPFDALVFGPDDVDLSRSPLAGRIDAETYCLGAFNPGLTRLPNGNLLMMVRVAEALRRPKFDGHVHSIRWVSSGQRHAGGISQPDTGRYQLDAWPVELVDAADPRQIEMRIGGWRVLALTSISWLLPVELTADGRAVVAVHYHRAIAPGKSYQCYGVEDPRISRVGDRWLMTTCSVSPERLCTTLYTSDNALDWRLEGVILDHQNKDMLIFEGLIGGRYWAQTRPLGEVFLAYPPGSEYRPGPSINLASSPDALHWKPCDQPGIRPHSATLSTARIGGGAPPVLTERGWLTLWHGAEQAAPVGKYRTYWSILDRNEPWRVLDTGHKPLLEPAPALTEHYGERQYVTGVVFTTGLVDGGENWIIASGEADLACRVTHVPKGAVGVTEEQDRSRFKLPAAIKPVWDLLVHLTIGAVVFGGVLLLALVFAGLIRLIGFVPFAPWWLVTAAEHVEQVLFGLDLFAAGLFLSAEVVKLVRGIWKELRHD